MPKDRPEAPILRHMERVHYDSPQWHRDAGIKQRGLGIRDADDGFGDRVYQIDTIPGTDRRE